MAEPKTTRNDGDVAAFLAAVADPRRRADAEAACALMAAATGEEPVMWGSAIIGFGRYHYRYRTGRTGDWPAIGLSPRKQALTLYVSAGFEAYEDLLSRLGPHTTGRSCLYLKRLADVDQSVLKELVIEGFRHLDGRTVAAEQP
ncbi:hypothetical protein FHR83_004459 [Actinoplanes campanulatus]|uniref:YdhG-like domain-containing protein n=1 Tax=Actinoplanes campanulatus TaxID=113559 RepID=A0A7W5AIP9_9ACTN|nr:DUF1801 domain-containing protein [Actinoplanes campanulatus]MBB3096785.1 hypothetical protein [Actinoplanes campanulatus]GGN31259.1 hypothetical protein GCM10010109_51460 [Actinoplanes campanulatus]GID37331.1 hypothetical protein Aca09nite_38370 [Actinoplanes campanulatus]